MNCAEAEELLGAYTVDALPHDEAARFRLHLTTCDDHRAQAAEMRAFAATLAYSADALPPPPTLRARVLDAVAREPQDSASFASAPLPITTARIARDEPRRIQWAPLRAFRAPQAWGALAAAIIAGLLVWNVVLQSDSGGSDRLAAADADAAATLLAGDVPVGTVLIFDDEERAIVVANGVAALDDTKTYQMWAITDDGPVSLGTMAPDENGRASSEVPLDASRARSFAVTVEPAGGSPQPTSDPIFIAQLPS